MKIEDYANFINDCLIILILSIINISIVVKIIKFIFD